MVGVSSRPKAVGSSQSPSFQKSSSKDDQKSNQKTLLGFWQKKSLDSPNTSQNTKSAQLSSPSLPTQKKTLVQGSPRPRVPVLTPAPSSDATELEEDSKLSKTVVKPPLPMTPALSSQSQNDQDQAMPDISYSSPSRRVSLRQTRTCCSC